MQGENLKLEDLLTGNNNLPGPDKLNNVAIIGAGVMGQGIAQTIASAGIDVILIEKNKDKLKDAKANLSENIDREIKRWAMTNSEKKSILSRISWELTLDKVADRDLIIEAVDEDLDLKKEIFRNLDKIAKKNAIFVSNTSTLSLTKIAIVNAFFMLF